jgi:hypothetical protein
MIDLNRNRFVRGAVAGLALLAVGAASVTGAAHAAGIMTQEMFVNYYKLFSANDPRYGDMLDENVYYPHITGRVFHNRKEVMAFYASMMQSGVIETRTPTTIVIDNADGLAAVELTVHITAKPGAHPTLPTGEKVNPGDDWVGHNMMIYGIKGDKIISIRGASSGALPFKKMN